LPTAAILLPYASRRRTWTASRLVRYPNGRVRAVLDLLAEQVFGAWDPKVRYAVWEDRNPDNEKLENVKLYDRKKLGPEQRNPYGHPAGTKEYHRAYRLANKDKHKVAQTKWRQKSLSAVAKYMQEAPPADETIAGVGQARLEAILGRKLTLEEIADAEKP
jgi:hypothetical protein